MKKLAACLIVSGVIFSSATAFATAGPITAQTYVANFGQTVKSFVIEGVSAEEAEAVNAEDFVIVNDITNAFQGSQAEGDVLSVDYEDGKLILNVDEFLYLSSNFVVAYTGDAGLALGFTKDQIDNVTTETADDFVAGEHGAVHYRLYVPEEVTEPLPIVIWTHGGGEGGDDNWIQLVANRGAIAWVERYKDIVVLAPQTNAGWSEDESLAIGEVVQDLIDQGIVDASRVYGTGCSAGGRGCILTCYRNLDMYAAIAPICPTMMDDTMGALIHMADLPIWISTAFEDHTPNRDEYITATTTCMKALGGENVFTTFYQPEEFPPYGLAIDENSPSIKAQYHHSWVLTLNNEYGIMDWLMEQRK